MSSTSDRNDGFNLTPIIFGLPSLAAFIYAVNNRTLEDFLVYGSVLAVLLQINLVAIILMNWYHRKEKPNSGDLFGTFVIFPFAACLGGAVFYSIGVAIKDNFLSLLGPTTGSTFTGFVAAMITLSLGVFLFMLRLRARIFYGISEVVVGVSIAVYRVTTTLENSLFASLEMYIAVLTAGVYLIVRGLDNMHQGIKTKSPEPIYKLVNSGASNVAVNSEKVVPANHSEKESRSA